MRSPLQHQTESHPPSDEELVAATCAGCDADFNELARRYGVPRLSAWVEAVDTRDALSPGDKQAIAEDVASKLREIAHKYRRDKGAKWSTYLYIIVRREAYKRTADRERRREISRDQQESDTLDPPSTELGPAELCARHHDEEEARKALALALMELPAEQGLAVLWTTFRAGLSSGQIATLMGTSEGNVRSLRARGFARLFENPLLREWRERFVRAK